MATKTEEMLAELTQEVRVSNQQWEEQARVNKVVLRKLDEYGRAIHGYNDHVGLVGGYKTQDIRITTLETAELEHTDRLRFARRLVFTQLAVVIGGLILAGFLVYLGWR